MFATSVGILGYKFATSYLNFFYKDKGVQTSAWEDYSNRTSQMDSNSVTSIDTITPISPAFTSETENTMSTMSPVSPSLTSDTTQTLSTILPVPPVNVEIIPNPDLVGYNLSHKSLVELKIQ